MRLAAELAGGGLAVQGPPGSGKTYTASEAVVGLVADGCTVGVTANSHAVITNLLEAIMERARERGITLQASQKAEKGKAIDHPSVEVRAHWRAVVDDLDSGVKLVAGTAWLFARAEFDQKLDYLIIDEAGQLSLANVLAVGTSARNLMLVGDPMQLAQPSHGTHPPGAEASGLEHVLDGADTMPGDRGIFMEHTRRLHPDICAFVSEVVYEGRLESLPGCERQAIGGHGPLSGSGLRWVGVDHGGNRVSSPEEAEVVRTLFAQLVGRSWTDKDGLEQRIGLDDVLVVAPYNAQVALLARRPAGGGPGRDGRQVPGPAGARRPDLAGHIERGRRPTRHGVPLQPEPVERRRVPGAGPDGDGRIARAPCRRLPFGRSAPSRKWALSLCRDGPGDGVKPDTE